MNTTARHTTRTPGRTRARRTAALSVAGLLAALAFAPTSAHASQAASGGGSTASTGDKFSYMYDGAQRREAMARVQADYDASASDAATTGSQYVNAWSYMYEPATPHRAEGVRHHTATSHLPLAKSRRETVPQRKAHPALANIVVSVAPKAPATCYLPDTVDASTRRLIAIQLCSKAHIVPAVFLARAAAYEPAIYSLGHL